MCGPSISKNRIQRIVSQMDSSGLTLHTVTAPETLSQAYGLVMVFGDTDVTLPNPAVTLGKPITFKNMDNGTQRILPPAGVTIEFDALLTNNTRGNTWTVVSDGTQYLVL